MEIMMDNFVAREWSRIDSGELDLIVPYLNQIPVKISGISNDLGIPVLASTLPPGISGEIRPYLESPSGFQIKVNRHENVPRQRFTVAHEIAHFLLHREEIGDGIVDSVLYRSSKSSKIEAEANRLAADIIMPAGTITRWQNENNFRGWNENSIELVANKFKVSKAALKIRYGL